MLTTGVVVYATTFSTKQHATAPCDDRCQTRSYQGQLRPSGPLQPTYVLSMRIVRSSIEAARPTVLFHLRARQGDLNFD